jgi:sulfide:quinone oxidoreductase
VIAKLTRAGSTFLVESYSAAATRDAAVQGDRLRRACAELRAAGLDVDYVGALAVPQDELVLHVVVAADGAAVNAAAQRSAPVVGATESAKLEAIMEAAAIGFHRGRTPVEVTPDAVRFADDTTLPFDLLLAVPPHRCPAVLVDAGLAALGGWVTVDPTTLETRFRHVYAIGDCTVIKLANGLPLPKAGVFAEAEGYVVAERIADELARRSPSATFAGEGFCYAEVGGGRAAAVRGQFLAVPPVIALAEPSPEYVDAKVAFEADRLRAWFGR